ncbi:TonB-dependent receptor [Mucilaginibacter sp. SP1R1]|uniref:TonB-dependent receptor n=1 Tax=Mucilaginibacter sp. SP1R1 TaxID=2723091 RepID=UPI001607BB51|nr:TonB-dependent receptor [Mucilaginibacter sp. SP1R1]
MKFVVFFMTLACLQASATGFAQQITLSEKNISIKKVFTAIQKQTQYIVWYEDKVLQGTHNISISLDHASLQQALELCFKDQPLIYSIIDKTIVVRQKENKPGSQIQNITVKGQVNDENGLPLPGVTVKLKGSSVSMATDLKGAYALSVPDATGTLVFSFIGYKTLEVEINGRTDISVQLKPQNSDLNEVVVVGFGTQKKVDLTGAVDQIKGKDLQNRPVTNVGDALQGMMANLNVTTNYGGGSPDSKKSINVRGFTGYGGQLAGPLILVDGVETDINSINVNDIENISLLKDAASSAVYGSRAPNGVLLITTKQGKKNQPARLSYSNNFSYSQPLNEPTMSNSLIWANTMNEAYTNAGLPPLIPNSAISRIQAYLKDPQNTPSTIPVPGTNNWASYDPVFGNANNDWFKVYLKKWSPSQQHNLSIDGGSDKITYFIGLGSTKKNGLFNYADDSYQRNNLRANVTADLNKYVTFSLKTSFSQENDHYPYNGGSSTGSNFFHQVARIWPVIALTDPNGGLDQASYISQLQQGGVNNSRTNNSRISGDITIKPITGWDITGHYSYDYNTYNITSTILPYYYSTPNNPQTLSNTISSINQNYGLTSYYNYNFFTSYEKQIGGHYFKVLVGQQTEQKTYSNLSGYNQYLYSTSQPSLALTSGTTPSTTDAGGYSWATNSTIGRVNYNYDEKYLVEGNASYMGTSLFPQNTRYHLFASGSVGWNVSKEDFFKPLEKSISNLKFRASYGGLGDISYFLNASPAIYYPALSNLQTNPATNSQWIFNPGSGGRLPYVSNPGNLISPTLTWAKPSMLDIGMDVDFLTDFNITADWYNKKITDQFAPSSTYPGTLGIAPPTVNNATSSTKGWDLTASWKHQFGKVHVMARANIGHYSGKITKYDANPQQFINQPYVGEQLGAIWGFKTVGKFQTQDQVNSAPNQNAINASGYKPGDIQYADLNKDGKITYGSNTVGDPGDRTIIGNTTPKYLYGFTTGASWKGIDLYIFIQGQGHTDYAPGNNYFWGLTSEYQSTITPKLDDRWSAANPNGYFPRLDINNGSSKNQIAQSGYLLNAAYMRLKNVQLGYTFPNKLTQKFHVYQLKLYGSVDNALTFTGVFKHQYVDPELLQSDEKIYPLQRTYSFGLQMNIK